MSERVLTERELNRALLARQLLLARARLTIPRALDRIAGIQAQYAPSSYIRLWTMLDRFELGDLTGALERRSVVQGTLMRSTIHLVSAREYWLYATGVGPSQQAWWLRRHGRRLPEADLDVAAAKARRALAGATRHASEVDTGGAWVELVRVPPSGTWERRRADLFRLAEEWLEPTRPTEEEGLEHLLRRYLGGFGPARLADAADWAGVPVAKLKPVAERLRLRTFCDDDGRLLLDLPRAPLPAADAPAPPRFLPTWDATLLVHARRTQILPERFRGRIFHVKTPHSFNTFLVDGAVAGTWRVEQTKTKAELRLEPFERLPRGVRRELEEEGARLVRFHEPDAGAYAVRVRR